MSYNTKFAEYLEQKQTVHSKMQQTCSKNVLTLRE